MVLKGNNVERVPGIQGLVIKGALGDKGAKRQTKALTAWVTEYTGANKQKGVKREKHRNKVECGCMVTMVLVSAGL